MKRVADELKNFPPLRGIIHAAGVAADKPLSQLTEEDFVRVLQAKVQGASLLHALSLNFELDFSVYSLQLQRFGERKNGLLMRLQINF